MYTLEIPIRQDDDQLAQRIEQACAELGLLIQSKTTLKKYPGSVHWHVKNALSKGILEITLWELQCKAWFSVHENRRAAWIETFIAKILEELDKQ